MLFVYFRAISSGFFLDFTRLRKLRSSESERGPVVLGRLSDDVSSISCGSSIDVDSTSDSTLAVAVVEMESAGENGFGVLLSKAWVIVGVAFCLVSFRGGDGVFRGTRLVRDKEGESPEGETGCFRLETTSENNLDGCGGDPHTDTNSEG